MNNREKFDTFAAMTFAIRDYLQIYCEMTEDEVEEIRGEALDMIEKRLQERGL